MELNDYQKLARKTDQRGEKTDELSKVIPLLGLVGEIGSVAAEHKKRLRDGQSYSAFTEKFKEELGDVLWYISTLAGDMNITLEDVAVKNLVKTNERWSELKNSLPLELFDQNFLEKEQLPRELTIEFRNNEAGRMEMYNGETQLGDSLSDNAHEEDGYRFHDVFHLAYMANLGWSPVIRKLLGKKRKSNKKIDEVEDGARAGIIEEGISAIVYDYAREHNFFENISMVDYDLLKTIKGMVKNLEVRIIPTSLWEKSIIEGFSAFRQLRQGNGGKVYLNLNKRAIKFLC